MEFTAEEHEVVAQVLRGKGLNPQSSDDYAADILQALPKRRGLFEFTMEENAELLDLVARSHAAARKARDAALADDFTPDYAEAASMVVLQHTLHVLSHAE